ncbi:SusC/RagA family TonB-linked outer membrane protein [Flavobacterium sp. MAHUQ-51]|uniref:SusC/RagA family TonB-linked outer membrane protein n=1 Tax=Flavobacterium sp. GCM10022190 TaxID=3252639 RepID=UPI00362275F8
MKTFIFLFCNLVFSITPNNLLSQNKIIKIQRDTSLNVNEVFDLIMDQTEYNFIYEIDLFKNSPKIILPKGNISTEKLLQKVLANKHLQLVATGNNTIIIKKSSFSSVQQNQITGKVIDEKGLPIPGVNINIKGTTKATVTDFDGQFSINASTNDVLEFSFIGYKNKNIIIGSERNVQVVLESDVNKLDEVLVTGYKTLSRKQATGAFSKIGTEDFKSQRLNSLSTIIEGRVAGFQNGVLRGTTTMKGFTTPLYVIDGFPIENTRYSSTGSLTESLPDLNLDDIENITVLKDAAATSIYGARAANGVVVIVTKKSKKGKTNISFSSNLTITPYRYYTDNLTDSEAIIDLEKEWANKNPKLQATNGSAATYANSLLNNAVFTSFGLQSILNYYAGKTTQATMNATLNDLASNGYKYYDDMAKYAKRSPMYQQHNLTIGKASEQNNFNASITYRGNEYEDINTKDKSLGINLRNSTEVTDWLTIDVGAFFKYLDGNTQTFNVLSPGLSTYQPYNSLVDDQGNPFVYTAASRFNQSTLNAIQSFGLYNMDLTPMDELNYGIQDNKNFLSRNYIKANFKLASWLKHNTMFQYEYASDRGSLLRNKESYGVRNRVNQMASAVAGKAVYNLPYGNIYNETNQYSNAYNFRQQLDITKNFGDKHFLSAIVGNEIRHSKNEYRSNTLYNFDPSLLTFSPVNQGSLLNPSGLIIGGSMAAGDFAQIREITNRFVSLYGNADYTFNKKYTASGSLRWDRSNLWGTDNKYQNKPTWSVGAAWNISDEDFFNVSWIDMLKLRVSNGIGGNIAKDSAPYMTAFYFNSTTVGGTYGYVGTRPNPELSWEKTTTTNLGVDFALFKNRLNGTVELYNKKGQDLLANTQGVPTEGWGYSTYTINNGEMQNRGIEVTLNGTVIKTNNFSWNASAIYGYNKNKVTYVNVKAPFYILQIDYPSEFPRIGTPYNSIYGYKWAGLSATGLPQVYNSQGTAQSSQPTDLESIVNLGTTTPKYSGSFGSTFKYKNVDLSMLFIYQGGHKIRNNKLPMLNNTYNSAAGGYITTIGVVNSDIKNRWRNPGDELTTNIPRAVFEYDNDFSSALYSIYSLADINVLDATNIRLSNISLGYNFPSSLVSKLRMAAAHLNFNVENVFTLAHSNDAKFMLGGFNSPNFVFGLNVNF